PVDFVEDESGGLADLVRHARGEDLLGRAARGVEASPREIDLRAEHLQLDEAPLIANIAIEMPEAFEQVHRVPALAVVRREIGQQEEDPTRTAVALRLVDEQQRVERRRARLAPGAVAN